MLHLLVEFDLNEAVRVRADDEVDLSPVDHDHLLDVVHNVWQLRRGQTLKTLVKLGRSEISVQNLLFMEPLCTKDLFFRGLIGVVMDEVGHDIVFLFLFG